MSRLVFESPSARARVDRAASFLGARGEPHVTVVAASVDAAGEVARIALSRGGDGARASLGWQRTTLGAIAASLARPDLARRGLAPASALALEAICARVVHDHGEVLGRLTPIRERPGLPRALARTLGEIRLARAPAVADPDLARLLAAYEAELDAAKLADRARTLEIAAAAARGRTDIGALLLVDVPLRSRAERDLVEALAAGAPAALAVLPTGDDRALELTRAALGVTTHEEHVPGAADGPLAPLWTGLFGAAASDGPPVPDDAVTVLSAPGESRECVEIARLVIAEAARSGTPLDRMAVLLRAPQYGAHVVEAFRRAEIPVFFARGTKRPDPSGRAFLALLACAAEQLSARRFSEYLSLGEVPDDGKDGAPPPAAPRAERVAAPDDETLHALVGASAAEQRPGELDEPALAEPAPPPVAEEDRGAAFGTLRTPRHWERLLVEASVIGEAGRWRSRLTGLAEKLASDVAAYDKKDEGALADVSRRELAALEALRRFALPLIDDLAALPKRATWGDWIDKLGALASRALRRPDRVLAVLGELEPMSKVANVGIDEVRLVLEPRLSQLRVPELGRRYGKVFVATTDEARGLAFDVVFVPGLAEKMFPQKVVEDPLLLDTARQRLSPDLPTNKDRTDEERLALRLAVGAASRRVVLSYPRLDVEQARPRTPSFYGLEVLRVAEGRLGDFEHLAKKAASTAEARIGWPAPARREDAVDEAEYDLALLKDVLEKPEDDVDGEGRYLIDAKDANAHLARALRFRWMRWDPKQLRGSDGLVAPPPEALAAIHEHTTDKRSFSPTALQNFAACPYRFLLSAVHRLAPREEPDAIEDMDALTKGSLVHEVQYRLLTRLREDGLLPIAAATLEAARERLDAVLPEVAGEYFDRLSPAIPRVWDDAITGIGADLREWLRRMVDEPDWTPAHFELSFGLKDPRAQDAKSTDEPVKLDIGLRLRGSIDLVERKKSGALRATDHKTGKVKAKKDETVIGGGEILQPVLYALTLERMFPGTRVEDGVLYYCTSAGEFTKVRVPLDDDARAGAHMVAKTVSDALVKGFLPAAPNVEKRGYSACTWCDFKPVCGPYEEIRTRKKPQGPLKVLAELRKRK
ncbi:MAG: exodeoxyribonuclease V subunit gamma [Labilithrix sp.]|nr:exodeoxyribonuclease V subunit gamma [Labilithrix sp.]